MTDTITSDQIKELRDRTGIAIGKCKEALTKAGGDMDLAIENLRKAGMASAVKKEGRATNVGQLFSAETSKAIAIIEVMAETDFVVKNELFQKFVHEVAMKAAEVQATSIDALLQESLDASVTVDQKRANLIQQIGENIQISRIFTIKKNPGSSYGVYSHLGGKILTFVEVAGLATGQDLAKQIAIHIAAASPRFLSENDVPAEVMLHEKEIYAAQVQGKPENIVEKIVGGKLQAFYDDVCLTRQKYIRDDSKTITQLVKETNANATLAQFQRWAVGETGG